MVVGDTWFYLDDDGKEQGPWSTRQLLHWLTRNVLPLTTPLKSSADGQFVPVGDHPDLQQEPQQQAPPPPQQQRQQQQAPPPQQPQFGGDPWRRGDVPRNPALVNTIEKLAAAVRKVGPQMESTVRERQRGNPEFAFLFGGEGAAFYQALRNAPGAPPGPGNPPGGPPGGPPGPGGAPGQQVGRMGGPGMGGPGMGGPGMGGQGMGGPGMGGPGGGPAGGFKRDRQW